MTTIVNYGAGKNSTAMIIAMWLKNEPINAIVFADTGNEKAETYAFIEIFNNWLKSVGLPAVTRVHYALKQRNSRFIMYPAIKSAGSLLAWCDIEELAEYQGKAKGITNPMTALGKNFKWRELHQLPPYKLAEPPKPCSCIDAGYEQLELFPD